jgi:CSLREA domain-containing protein
MTRIVTQRRILLVATLIASVAAIGAGQKIFTIFAAPKTITQPTSARVTVQRETNAKTSIKLSEARKISNENQSLENALGSPLALAAADFNEDGTPDVVAANGGAGLGTIRIYRGNPEAIYGANSLTNSVAPFFGNAAVVALAATPDFIEAGDFNGDAHQDLLFAARLGQKLFLLAGDGKDGFEEAKEFSVNGQITAMTAGEFNHHDGVMEVAIALQSEGKFEILLYQNSQGTMSAEPKSFAVSQPVTAMTLGQMNNDFVADLAAAAGTNLYLIEARDEALTVATQVLPSAIQSMAVGRFDTLAQDQLAVLTENDEVYAMRAPQAQTGVGRRRILDRTSREWRAEKLITPAASTEPVTSSGSLKTLVRTRISTSAYDDLLILDSSSKSLNIFSKAENFESTKISFENENAIVAALPMRLNAMALNGLVMLRSGQNSLEYAVPEAAMTFTVNSTLDTPDNNPGDGVCGAFVATGAPLVCTLRAAIEEANANVGADTILFNIGNRIQTISPLTAFQPITEAVTIDAYSPALVGQIIYITPNSGNFGCNPVLDITGGSSFVRGFRINGFSCNTGIRLLNGGNNFIENNDIIGNGSFGVVIDNSTRNSIGGITATGNNIRENVLGEVLVVKAGSTLNLIRGNTLQATSPSSQTGSNEVLIAAASNNSIGGLGAISGNTISSTSGAGIVITTAFSLGRTVIAGPAVGNGIQANRIVNTAPNVNSNGIDLVDAFNTIIGTPLIGAAVLGNENTISGWNVGIAISRPTGNSQFGTGNSILRNSISGNSGLGIDLGVNGVTLNDAGDGDAGPNNSQNFPVLNQAYSTAQGAVVNGTLNSTPSSQFILEFFSNAKCHSSGYGEGEIYIGTTTVTTDANGNATFSFAANVGSPITVGRSITATATDTSGNTSEFSACVAVQAAADLGISQTVTQLPPTTTGIPVTYTITVVNNGVSASVNPGVRIDPPALLIGVTCTAPAGWSCNQDGSPFFASTANFAPGSAVFTLRGTYICNLGNASLTSIATISAGQTLDPITTNNSSTLNTPVLAGSALATVTYDGANPNALSLGPVVVGSGNAVSGTFTLENTGCVPINLTTAQFQRQLNAAVPNLGLIDDARYFAVRIINADNTETALNPAGIDRDPVRLITLNRILNPAQKLRFRVLFNPPLPFFAGTFARSDLGLNANQVLPSQFNSRLNFNFITGGNTPIPSLEAAGDPGTVSAALIGNTSPAVQIIPRDGLVALPGAPLVVLEQVREDFRVKVSMYDSNKNINKITYQFIDTFNQLVGKPIEVALTQPLSASAILPGQCFTLQVDFTGAAARPDVTKVRVVVTDDDGTSVTAGSSGVAGTLASPTTVLLESLTPSRSDVIVLQPMSLSIGGRTDAVISRENNSRKGNE